ncbi:MAG: NUDIX domain-containing protein [Terrimonas sp.]|nr:NUDIX domain-containing protein [Terrimonas sp.]
MYLKIYFNNKPLFLCDDIDQHIEPFLHHDDAVFIDELDSHTLKTMIHEMQEEKVHAGVFYHPDLLTLKNAFFKKFIVIQAAGGAVLNEENELLMIYRRGCWDLPKGKLDEGEDLPSCAIREVMEETGLPEVRISAPLQTTYHTYHEGTKFLLKESHWYKMSASKLATLIPQTEEDILDIRWVHQENIPGLLEKSFPSIRDVVREVFSNP